MWVIVVSSECDNQDVYKVFGPYATEQEAIDVDADKAKEADLDDDDYYSEIHELSK